MAAGLVVIRAAGVLLVALWTVPAWGEAGLDAEEQARYRALIGELRCLVCQNQNIAESNAPLAADLREKVRDQIIEGRSDAEIKVYLTDRYGDFVLYEPPLKPKTWLLWFGPALVLLLAAGTAWMFVRRARRAPRAAVNEAELRRLLDEERE